MASPAPPSAGSQLGDRKNTGWIMDTFATNHMTGDPTHFSSLTLTPVSSNQVIGAGNGKGMRVCGNGCVSTGVVALPDVWYVPGLTDNLVSLHQLNNADVTVEIAGRGYIIKKTSDASVVGRVRRRLDNKYEVDFLRIPQN